MRGSDKRALGGVILLCAIAVLVFLFLWMLGPEDRRVGSAEPTHRRDALHALKVRVHPDEKMSSCLSHAAEAASSTS